MMMAAESFECYKWNCFAPNIMYFFGGNKTILVGCAKNKKQETEDRFSRIICIM